MTQVLVYGSLRKGQAANNAMRTCSFVEEVRVPGFDLHAVSWFPGIVKNPDNKEGVVCELYKDVDEATLTNLDYYEGYRADAPERSLFIREEVEVKGEPAFIYVFNQDPTFFGDLKVEGGDWVKFKENDNAA